MNEKMNEGEQRESPPKRNYLTWLGQVMNFAGIIGVIAIVLLMIVLPFAADQVGNNLETGLVSLADGLENLSATAELINSSLGEVANALTNTASTLEDASRSLDEVIPLLNTVGTIAGETAPATIESTHEALLSAEAGAKAIDGVMRALSTVGFITGIQYNPAVPLDKALVQTAENLEPLPNELRQIQDELDSFVATVEHIQPGVELTAASLDDLSDSLFELQNNINGQIEALNLYQGELRQAAAGISTWVWIAAIMLEILLLWAIFGQVTVIYVGRKLRDEK